MSKINRCIKFRAKEIHSDKWIKGTYYKIDDRTNNSSVPPFKEQHFIVTYDDKWEHSRVYRNTLQQFTGIYDNYGNEIYEGDVVRIFNEISFDMDGTCTEGDSYVDDVVYFENGKFKLGNDKASLSTYAKSFSYKIQVVGNALELKDNNSAIYFRSRILQNIFESNITKKTPEYMELAFMSLSIRFAKIMPHFKDINCLYNNKFNRTEINFTYKDKTYFIAQNVSEEKLGNYILGERYIMDNTDKIIIETDNFQEIIDNAKNKL